MQNQVECPICGGFKVGTQIRKFNPKSKKDIHFAGRGMKSLAWFFTIVAVLGIPMYWDTGPQLVMGSLFWGILGITMLLIIRRRLKNSINHYYNDCMLCGYKWDRLETEPEPPVTVRPDLIEKGATELKRQQEADAAAAAHAYYLSRNKNNE
jgi:hypothetical protein